MFQQLTPITKNIIILNVIVYILANFVFSVDFMYSNFSAFFPTSPLFKSWQIITHMFMHSGIMHIAFNMLTLASFGPVLERFLGDRKFLILYFLSGFGALALNFAWEGYQINQIVQYLYSSNVDISSLRDGTDIIKNNLTNADIEIIFSKNDINSIFQQTLISRMVGASGAIFGVVAAFTALYPNAEMMIMFIPFPIKAKILLPIVIIGSLYLGINNYGGIAHFAHIGGALVGYLLIKFWGRNRYRIN